MPAKKISPSKRRKVKRHIWVQRAPITTVSAALKRARNDEQTRQMRKLTKLVNYLLETYGNGAANGSH